jgi:hypothetical protein
LGFGIRQLLVVLSHHQPPPNKFGHRFRQPVAHRRGYNPSSLCDQPRPHSHKLRPRRRSRAECYRDRVAHPTAVAESRASPAYERVRALQGPLRLTESAPLRSVEPTPRSGIEPLAKIVSWATAGVDPAVMGSGPIPAFEWPSHVRLWRPDWLAGAAGFEPLHIRIGIRQDSQPGGRDSNLRISN